MKRFLVVLAAGLLVLAPATVGAQEPEPTPIIEIETEPPSTPEATPEPTPEPAPEATPEPADEGIDPTVLALLIVGGIILILALAFAFNASSRRTPPGPGA